MPTISKVLSTGTVFAPVVMKKYAQWGSQLKLVVVFYRMVLLAWEEKKEDVMDIYWIDGNTELAMHPTSKIRIAIPKVP